MTKNELGRRGEEIAAAYLDDIGMRVLERNWRCRDGEIDIVALDRDTIVVVEVKTRSGPGAGHPLEAITPAKLARLRRLAIAWSLHDDEHRRRRLRIDAIGIVIQGGQAPEIIHLDGIVA